MADKMSIILFSGTMDKLLPVGVLASGGVAMGMDVEIFATFWGLQALTKGAAQQPPRMSKDFEDMAPMMMQLMQEKNVPSFLDTLKTAKELGNVRVLACSMTMDLMDLTKEDFVDIVDDVVGVGEFVDSARDAKITLFI
ncbi:MAG: peroxiredoxin [Methanomassiliicoccales archaeon]|nr:MAG: peroxiredoxin [Methanomassiliicoccales archaeon]